MYEHHTITIPTSTGITIVSRIPLSQRGAQGLGRASDATDEIRHIQSALATLPDGQGSVYIYNTHVSQNPPAGVADQRAAALSYATAGLTAAPPRRIVCGDFNSPPPMMVASGWAEAIPWKDVDYPAYNPTIPAFPGAGTIIMKEDYILRLDGTYFGWAYSMPATPRIVENKVSDHKIVIANISGI